MEAIQKAKILFYQGKNYIKIRYICRIVKNDKLQEALDVLDDSINLYNKDDGVQMERLCIINQLYCLSVVNSLSRLQESIECNNQAISINPNNDSAWINKGFALSINLIAKGLQTVQVDTKRRQNVVIKLYQLILIVITHGIIRVSLSQITQLLKGYTVELFYTTSI